MNRSLNSRQSIANRSKSYSENGCSHHVSNWSDQVLDQQPVTQLSEVAIPAALSVPSYLMKAETETSCMNREDMRAQTEVLPTKLLQGQGSHVAGDIAHQRMVAGVLAMFLGGLGVHKFYLGLNQAGVILLATHIGVWFLAMFIGVLTLGIGMLITIPFVIIISILISLGAFVEGLMYLTKSDQDFEQQYLIEKRQWF